MNKPLLLLGAGGHAKVVVDLIESSTDIKILGFLDSFTSESKFLGYPILGADDELLKFSPREADVFVSIGFVKSAEKRNEVIKPISGDSVAPSSLSPAKESPEIGFIFGSYTGF